MPYSRRHLLRSFAALTGGAAAAPLLMAQSRTAPQHLPSPNERNPTYPQGVDGPPLQGPDQKTIERQNQAQIRADVDKMYTLITDLKKELAVTNTTTVLDVGFVKKAHEIEKLAKQVKDLAKG